jgi:diaminopimelate epimerase
MTSIPFAKAHGLGNDFLIVEESAIAGRDPARFAMTICDRHSGVGADGIVILGRTAGADASFRIYNADGSEATLSGNALRCAGAWLVRKAENPGTLTLETRLGPRSIHFLRRERDAVIFRTEIGAPSFAAKDVPFAPPDPATEPIVAYPLPVDDAAVPATILHMGNPQCILFVENWSAVDWMGLGRILERHASFPDRANIGFVRAVDSQNIEARFWERGAGHTLASGTGSCACAVAANLAGKCGREVRVHLERGEMEVHWRDDGIVELTGPAVIAAEGHFFL